MKPIIITCRGVAFVCNYPRRLTTSRDGRTLQLIYETGDLPPKLDVDVRIFHWPWDVQVGARFNGNLDEPIF
jgi:hypothetical protein